MSKPNVIVITCHDLGDYLGCYGVPVETPNLDALAGQGILFENHFSTGTICSPSRGSIITGCYPHTHGLMGLVHRGWQLNEKECPPLPAILRAAGYRTCLFGFQHEHWDPYRLGYESVQRPKICHCDEVTPIFQDWLRRHAKADSRPFLASVGFREVHRMGVDPSHFKRDVYEPADPAAVRIPPYLPDIPEVRSELADFYGAIKLVDRTVGDILATLEEVGLGDETIVLFTTDHGASFMHAKGTLYDGGTKVACLLRCPGVIPAGGREKALTSHVDILPTLLDLLDLEVPEHVQGASLVSLFRHGAGEARACVFGENNYTDHYDPARMARSRSCKYIRKGLRTCIFDFVIREIELSPAGYLRNRKTFEFYDARRHTEELFDLAADPGELVNLVDRPEYRSVLEELRSALDEHLTATDDPFRLLRNGLLMPADTFVEVRENYGKHHQALPVESPHDRGTV